MRQLHKISTARGAWLGDGVSVHRLRIDDEIDVWLQQFHAARGFRRDALADRCEIGIQLEGGFFQRSHRSAPQRYEPGTLHLVAAGEVYEASYEGSGRVLWFSVDAGRLCQPQQPDVELSLVSRRGERCEELRELAELVFARGTVEGDLARAVRGALERFLRRRAELVTDARAALARHELEQHFDCELYLQNIAESVGLRPHTLLRRFARQYGTTPIQYRIKRRLNFADRLFAMQPKLSVAEVAKRAGFENHSYFHRQFTSYIGCTPGRRREVLATVGSCPSWASS